jgi:hypothetical protein
VAISGQPQGLERGFHGFPIMQQAKEGAVKLRPSNGAVRGRFNRDCHYFAGGGAAKVIP